MAQVSYGQLSLYRWCGPCKALAPLLEEAVEQQGVELARVDVDVLADIALEWEASWRAS